MTPYYEDHASSIVIYHGDAREVAEAIPRAGAIITDPVWPNAVAELAGSDDPAGLFGQALRAFAGKADRIVAQLGCDSDPRFLLSVPTVWPFFRSCHLEYVRPHYKGRLLYTHDVAYAFGTPPLPRAGRTVIPGRCIQTDGQKRPSGHPCPRQLQHVAWLVRWFADDLVTDPFCGTGTTLRACKDAGIPAIGIEINERYCEIAVRRLSQGVLPFAKAGC